MPVKRGTGKDLESGIKGRQDILSYLLMGFFFLLVIFFTNSKITNEDDLFWHLATGRYIVETKTVPSTDVFGFVTIGQEWIPFEWGWDVLNYEIFHAFDYFGVYLLNTILFLLIFFLIFRFLRKFNVSYFLIFFLLAFLLFGMFERIVPRPHAFSYLFITILILMVLKNRYFDRNNLTSFYFLPVMFIIWVNIHMGVIVGVVILATFLVSEFIMLVRAKSFASGSIRPLSRSQIFRIFVVFVACLISLLINPHGINTFAYIYRHLSMGHIGAVNEWISPFDKRFSSQFVTIVYYIYFILGISILYYSVKKRDIFAGLLFLVFAINSMRAVRYTVDLFIVTFIYFVLSVNFLVNLSKNNKFKEFLSLSLVPKAILSLVLIFIVSSVPGNRIYTTYLKYPRVFGIGVDSSTFPARLFRFVKENSIENIGEKPFNSYECGGYFSWNFPGKLNFIDSRAVNERIMSEYDVLFSKRPGFEQRIKAHNFDYAICFERDMVKAPQFMRDFIISYFASHQDEWKLVYWDDISFLFLKNIPKFQTLIEKYEYKYVNPYNVMFQKNVIDKAYRDSADSIINEINRKLNEEPEGQYINYISKIYDSKIH